MVVVGTAVVATGTVVVAGTTVVVGGTVAVDGTAVVVGVPVVVGATVVAGAAVVVGATVVVGVADVVGAAVVVGAGVAAGATVVTGVAVSELPPHPEATNKNVSTTACFLAVSVCHPSPEGGGGVSDALGVDTCGRYVRRSHTPPSWALLSFSGSVTVLHESGEPTEVSSPDRLQDGPRSDARQTSTDPPRKRQRLLPRESRLRRTYLPEGESTTA